jgi:hypothetical protein
MLDWLGGQFDPGRFDLQKVNATLRASGKSRATILVCLLAVGTPTSAHEFRPERLLEPWETGTRHLGGECAFSQPGVVTFW